MSINRIIIPCD